MEKETPSYYSILTADVRYSKKLTDFEKILYSEITSLSNINGYCTATNSYFAKLYGFNTVSISRNVTHLKDYGFIKVQLIRDDRKQIKTRRIYPLSQGGINPTVNTPINLNVNTPINPTVKGGINPKVKGNNTSINNTSINNMSKNSKTKNSDVTSKNYKAAKYLWEKIKGNNPKAKEPNLKRWSNDIRLMHERDKRSYTDIKNIIDWSQANSFWSTVILSPSKLRKQYDQLSMQSTRELKGKQNNLKPLNYDTFF